MSVRDGLPLSQATARQRRLDEASQERSSKEDARTVRRIISQYEAGIDNSATRVLAEWISSRSAHSA